jgi:hypothetical protein
MDCTSAELHREACDRTGLSDFGPDGYRRALDGLIDSARRQSRMHAKGWGLFREQLRTHLVNRLEIQDWIGRHPEILQGEIRAPLFIVGLPRTGTTALTFMLQQDPSNRMLITWEARHPCPPPCPETYRTDSRIEEVRAQLYREWFDEIPDFRTMHLMEVDGPDEDLFLLGNDFRSSHFFNQVNVPGYYAWLRDEADLLPTYRYHRIQLQLLQWRMMPGERWVLKFASHLLALDVIARVYPDAVLIFTHRDPVRLMASLCSLTTELRRLRSDEVDPKEIGRQLFGYLRDCVRAMLDFRSRDHGVCCVDLDYRQLVDDPLAALQQLYAESAIELTPQAQAALRRWRAENPPGKHGRHVYDLATFGIDRQEADAAFEAYRKRFEVAEESFDAKIE